MRRLIFRIFFFKSQRQGTQESQDHYLKLDTNNGLLRAATFNYILSLDS